MMVLDYALILFKHRIFNEVSTDIGISEAHAK